VKKDKMKKFDKISRLSKDEGQPQLRNIYLIKMV